MGAVLVALLLRARHSRRSLQILTVQVTYHLILLTIAAPTHLHLPTKMVVEEAEAVIALSRQMSISEKIQSADVRSHFGAV